MKTRLTKRQKRNSIYFTEADDFVEICTYNTDFKKRLSEFAVKYPAECRQLDDDGNGCKTFSVKKAVLASAWRHLTVKRDGKLPASWRRRTHRI